MGSSWRDQCFVRAQFPDPCKYCIEETHPTWSEVVGLVPAIRRKRLLAQKLLLHTMESRTRLQLLTTTLRNTKIQNTTENRRRILRQSSSTKRMNRWVRKSLGAEDNWFLPQNS